MKDIQEKQVTLSQIQMKRDVQLSDEVRQLFAREEVDLVIGAGRDLIHAVDRVSEKDVELKIIFCEANEHANKAKDDNVLVCRVPAGHRDQVLNVMTTDITATGRGLSEAMNECVQLSDQIEKQSVHSTKEAAELKNLLRSLN